MANLFTLTRPLLHSFPPETVHHAGLWALRHGLIPSSTLPRFTSLETKLWDLTFANPIGLAAGFDKNAVAINALFGQGFGFVETGTVTPKPQPGNPRPRIFRLSKEEAVINRLGFNNEGLNAFITHFAKRDKNKGIAGANIGKNKDSSDAIEDYVIGLRAVYPYADYITVNISSPNTQGLRDLQQREALTSLLTALHEARETCKHEHHRHVPLLLKVAPDLDLQEKENIAEIVMRHHMDGMIISNTTISRPASLRSPRATETGGLSGKPLFMLSTDALKIFYRLTDGKLPLIGVGGIASAQDAYVKIRAGASLVQLYTALVYQGFSLVRNIQLGLAQLLAQDGFAHISQVIGVDAAD